MTDALFYEINPQARAMTRDQLSSELMQIAHDLRDVTTPEQNVWLEQIAYRIPLTLEEHHRMASWRQRLVYHKGWLLHCLGSHRWCERHTVFCSVADARWRKRMDEGGGDGRLRL
jgi:hypothetical protein